MKCVLGVIGVLATLVALAIPAYGTAQPQGNTVVAGNITLDEFGNQLSVAAHETAVGTVSGNIILESGFGVVHGQSHRRIQIDVTCLEVSGSVAFVGGTTVRATAGSGTVHPQYGFVLEDRGPGLPDKWTGFALFATVPSNPCLDLFGPAHETALRGNIIISS
jgi:hypothetical protein